MQILKTSLNEAEYAEIVQILKTEGVTEQSPLPKVSVQQTKLKFEGLRPEYEAGKFGELYDGKNYWRPSHSLTPAQKLKSLIEYFRAGTQTAGLSEFLIPSANAMSGLGMVVAGGAYWLAINAVMWGVAALMGVAIYSLVPVLVGAAMAAAALIFIGYSIRMAKGQQSQTNAALLQCENGRMQSSEESAKVHLASLSPEQHRELCKPGVLDTLKNTAQTLLAKKFPMTFKPPANPAATR